MTRKEKLAALKVGDEITRMLAGTIPNQLRVTEVTEKQIICGAWTFHRETGMEIDEYFGWTGEPGTITGSFLKFEGETFTKAQSQ